MCEAWVVSNRHKAIVLHFPQHTLLGCVAHVAKPYVAVQPLGGAHKSTADRDDAGDSS